MESSHYKLLDRVVIKRDVNKVMRQVTHQFTSQSNITSYSFQIGSIRQVWKDTKDIESVRQTIGHRRLDLNLGYVNQMTDQEHKNRIFNIKV